MNTGSFTPDGDSIFALARELFPICRSITGSGLRETLQRIVREIPISIREVPSGTPVLDWSVPNEWNIREAWIRDAGGNEVVNMRSSNLHIVNYSAPVCARMDLSELKAHLHTLPDRPEWIPYKTSYYRREWGFCLAHRIFLELLPGEYDVCIDSSLAPGSLSYGEWVLPGSSHEEFLVSAHCCHPSLANDNLSGIVVSVALAQLLSARSKRHFTYRFLFAPGTIGAIAWLAANHHSAQQIRHGIVLTCVGDRGPFTYKRSRRGDAEIDRAAEHVLRESSDQNRVIDFSPYGYDERQFCSPGFDLPVGCLMRSQHGTFPEYHTSADNLSFISADKLEETLRTLVRIIDVIELGRAQPTRTALTLSEEVGARARSFRNLAPYGEPQLGKYGFYEAFRGDQMPALWVLNLSDGRHSLGQIAARASLPFDTVEKAADVLATLGLVREVSA